MREQHPGSAIAIERLRRRADFRFAARGVRAAAASFVLQARRRADEGTARVGFTVSRQVGNAVERNRVRRRLREMVRLSAAGRLCAGHDYVLIGRRSALVAPFGEMVQELDAALNRIHASGRGGTGDAGHRGVGHGDASHGPLHEAGRPSQPGRPRRNRVLPARPSEHPPQER